VDWCAARDVEAHGVPVPDNMHNRLKIQEAAAGWQLFLVDNDLRWRALGKPFIHETAAGNAGQIVLAAPKLLRRNA
jgi:hypothetical protein